MAVSETFMVYAGALLIWGIVLYIVWRITRTDHDDD